MVDAITCLLVAIMRHVYVSCFLISVEGFYFQEFLYNFQIHFVQREI
jgi:hypothetical protein